MKKMLFSAIAMVAFTLSANAANEVVESVEEVTTSSTSCATQYSNNYDYFISIGMSAQNAYTLAYGLFWNCLEKTYGPLPGTGKDTKEATPKQTETISPR